jgi:hypothetical protein
MPVPGIPHLTILNLRCSPSKNTPEASLRSSLKLGALTLNYKGFWWGAFCTLPQRQSCSRRFAGLAWNLAMTSNNSHNWSVLTRIHVKPPPSTLGYFIFFIRNNGLGNCRGGRGWVRHSPTGGCLDLQNPSIHLLLPRVQHSYYLVVLVSHFCVKVQLRQIKHGVNQQESRDFDPDISGVIDNSWYCIHERTWTFCEPFSERGWLSPTWVLESWHIFNHFLYSMW